MTLRTSIALALLASGPLALAACGEHTIPAHVSPASVTNAKAEAEAAAQRYLTGGERVFFDDFQRADIGSPWQVERSEKEEKPAEWRIQDGWVRNGNAKNQGLWAEVLPAEGPVRIEWLAKSGPLANGRFPGDLKIEAFGTAPVHESGYSFINGGWNNTLDTIAKRGEHSADDKRVPAKTLEPDRVYRYAIVAADKTFRFYRDGELLYTFEDPAPVRGRWLGLNNWLSNAAWDEVAVFKLTP